MKHTNIQPGPDLDRLVAEKIMGWTKKTWKDPYDKTVYTYLLRYPTQSPKEALKEILPAYSQDPSAATEVIEEMNNFGFQLYVEQHKDSQKIWTACFYTVTVDKKALVHGKSAEHAICLAALVIVR